MIEATQKQFDTATRIANKLHGTRDNYNRYLHVEVGVSAIIHEPHGHLKPKHDEIHVHVFDDAGGTRHFSLSWPVAAERSLEHMLACVHTYITEAPIRGPLSDSEKREK